MALTIRAGNNAFASGFCCVAVGDDTFARGAFQVALGTKLTLPDDPQLTTPEEKINQNTNSLNTVKEFIAIYTAMGEQGHTPPDFVDKANNALTILADTLTKKIEALKLLSSTSSVTLPQPAPAAKGATPTPAPSTNAPTPPLNTVTLQQPPAPRQ